MNQTYLRLALALSNRFYRSLLRLFQQEFQRVFSPRMARLFRDSGRDAVLQQGLKGLMSLWLHTLLDFTVNLVLEWADTLHKQRGSHLPSLLIFFLGMIAGDTALHAHAIAGLALFLLLCAGFLGWFRPKEAWQRAFLLAIGIPFSHLIDLITGAALPFHIYLL